MCSFQTHLKMTNLFLFSIAIDPSYWVIFDKSNPFTVVCLQILDAFSYIFNKKSFRTRAAQCLYNIDPTTQYGRYPKGEI